MKKSEKMMAGFLGVLGLGAFAYMVIWPKVIQPYFTLPETIKERKETLEKVKTEASVVKEDRDLYKEFVSRAGGVNPDKVKDDFNARIGTLMQSCMLRNQRVTPKKPMEDRKLKFNTISFSVSGEGTWKQVISFVKKFYQLPQVAQLTTLNFKPIGNKRAGFADNVKITGTIELIIPPTQSSVKSVEADPEVLETPRVKYGTTRLAMIERRNPFEPYKPPPPPPTKTNNNNQNNNGSKTVERDDTNWEEGREVKTVRATLSDAILVAMPGMSGKWFPQGSEFDGGKLLFVHPLGAVVRRKEKDYVYPLGEILQNCLDVKQARGYPEILVAWNRFVDRGGLETVRDRVAEPQEAIITADAGEVSVSDMEGPPWTIDEFDPLVPEDEVENGDIGEDETSGPVPVKEEEIRKATKTTRPVRKQTEKTESDKDRTRPTPDAERTTEYEQEPDFVGPPSQ